MHNTKRKVALAAYFSKPIQIITRKVTLCNAYNHVTSFVGITGVIYSTISAHNSDM
jgi:hypothetical protein